MKGGKDREHNSADRHQGQFTQPVQSHQQGTGPCTQSHYANDDHGNGNFRATISKIA